MATKAHKKEKQQTASRKPTSARSHSLAPGDSDDRTQAEKDEQAELAGTERKSTPRQADLPGMEDRLLPELEEGARAYAEIRDQRMALNKQESELKANLLMLMKKHEKETYRHGDVEIRIVHEEETIKVKVKAEQEDDGE